jgi:hypothetical protein
MRSHVVRVVQLDAQQNLKDAGDQSVSGNQPNHCDRGHPGLHHEGHREENRHHAAQRKPHFA